MGFQDAINSNLGYNVPDAGMYGAGATLPSNPGPPDPFIEPTPLPGTQNYPSPTPNVTYGAYPPPGYGNILSILDRYGVGGNGPSQSSGGGGGPGYTPSNIIQAYLDFYANNPSASGATATPVPGSFPSGGGGGPAGTYPAPGAANRQQPSILQRILGLHPASIIGRAIRDAITSNQTRSNMQSNPGSFQGPPAIPPGGALFGYNPNSGGAGGTRSYNYGTGNVITSPSSNPLYSTGGAFMPVSGAPSDIRFAQNSGTGNWTADQTTKAFELGGGYPGTPNRMANFTTDVGHNRFAPNASTPMPQFDPEQGGIVRSNRTFAGGQPDSRWVFPSQAESAALGLSFDAQKRNDWLMAHNAWAYPAQNSYGWMTPASISPPPMIGGGG